KGNTARVSTMGVSGRKRSKRRSYSAINSSQLYKKKKEKRKHSKSFYDGCFRKVSEMFSNTYERRKIQRNIFVMVSSESDRKGEAIVRLTVRSYIKRRRKFIVVVKIYYEEAKRSKQERPGKEVVGNNRGTVELKEPQAFAGMNAEIGN
nr:hypothetical protein [Tanacetum cinerariifolium]